MNPVRHASKHRKTPAARLRRVVIEHVRPEIDGGHFPIKRTVGEPVEVTADIHTDGHDVLSAVLRTAVRWGHLKRNGMASRGNAPSGQ